MAHPYAPNAPAPDEEKLRADILQFLDDSKLAMLVTAGKDGYPMARTMGFLHDGFSIWFTTMAGSLKDKQMRENSKVTVLWKEPHPTRPVKFLTLKGSIEIFSDVETVTMVRERYSQKYNMPNLPAGDTSRVVMKFTPVYARAEGFGYAPPPVIRSF